jgi:multidrug resistance efflux pump
MKIFHLNASSCSFAGETFDREKDGSFDVPAEAAVELVHHGFVTDRKLLEVGPALELAKATIAAQGVTAHVVAELKAVTQDRDDLAARVKVLEAELAAIEEQLEAATAPAPAADPVPAPAPATPATP